MIETIKKRIEASKPFRELAKRISAIEAGGSTTIRGVNGSLMAFVASALHEERQTQVVLLTADQDRGEQLRDDCVLLLGEHAVRLYAHGPSHKAAVLDMTSPIAQVEALKALAAKETIIVVTSAQALAGLIPPPAEFKTRNVEITAGTEHPFESLISQLAGLGFERKEFVEEYGDYSVRGGILDVFPFVGDNPIRIEFWGDSIESIREFDALSQRSIRELQSAHIVASLLPEDETGHRRASMLDYLSPDALIIVDEPAAIQREVEELFHEGVQGILSWESLDRQAGRFARVVHSFITSPEDVDPIDFFSLPQPSVNGSIKVLLRHVNELADQQNDLVLVCDTQEEADRLKDLIEEEVTTPGTDDNAAETGEDDLPSTSPPAYQLMTEALHLGFVFPPSRLALFTEHQIFGRLKRRGMSKRKRFKGFSQKEAQQLRRGDYVVHVDYGIGRFAGLQKLKVRGTDQEVMKVLYEANDVLYVNLNFVNRVQRYVSQEGHLPKLSKLGAPDWERLKSRARKRIKDIARELIALYARRRTEQGFSFAPDTHWQKELEASFIYEDTPDQAKATLDVKRDMELPSPMDRLICGDVGFGKTEVAVRAAFKSIMSSKQVAVLVPTTILAQQHFNTFVDRLGRYSRPR